MNCNQCCPARQRLGGKRLSTCCDFFRVIPIHGAAAQQWIRQRRPVDLRDEVTLRVEQMVEDLVVGRDGGLCCQ